MSLEMYLIIVIRSWRASGSFDFGPVRSDTAVVIPFPVFVGHCAFEYDHAHCCVPFQDSRR